MSRRKFLLFGFFYSRVIFTGYIASDSIFDVLRFPISIYILWAVCLPFSLWAVLFWDSSVSSASPQEWLGTECSGRSSGLWILARARWIHAD